LKLCHSRPARRGALFKLHVFFSFGLVSYLGGELAGGWRAEKPRLRRGRLPGIDVELLPQSPQALRARGDGKRFTALRRPQRGYVFQLNNGLRITKLTEPRANKAPHSGSATRRIRACRFALNKRFSQKNASSTFQLSNNEGTARKRRREPGFRGLKARPTFGPEDELPCFNYYLTPGTVVSGPRDTASTAFTFDDQGYPGAGAHGG